MIDSKCVVLNSTYEPLDIIPAKRGLVLYLEGKATVVDNYDYEVHSMSVSFSLPSMIALKKYVKGRVVYSTKAVLTQRNLFIRDNHVCQYCGRRVGQLKSHEILTRDHIVPMSRGGKDVWTNVVTSCSTCNNKKDDMMLKDTSLTLRKEPHVPTVFEILTKSKMKNFSYDDMIK